VHSRVILTLSLMGLLAACSPGTNQRSAPGDAARSFTAATQHHDGELACTLLSPAAAERVQAGGQICAQALTDLDLPAGTVERVEVWGDRARVKSTADTLFMVRIRGEWRVAAAGCRPGADGPYDCAVEA
jgi:hypothetical protein